MSPLRPNIANMKGYVPGFQPPDEQAFIKLNTNENPYPPSPKVMAAILSELGGDGASLPAEYNPNPPSTSINSRPLVSVRVDPCPVHSTEAKSPATVIDLRYLSHPLLIWLAGVSTPWMPMNRNW